jgi:hypothetical protein
MFSKPGASWVIWLAALAAAPAPTRAVAATAGVDAVIAVQASLEVERALLQEDTERYERLAARRWSALAELGELYRSLDVAVKRTDAAAPQAVEALMDEVDIAERERTTLLTAERVLADRIRERLRRITMLEVQVAELSEQSKATTLGSLTGSWKVTLLPTNQKGQFALTQTGTLVSGTYTLEGGWDGSLQGTLVSRKVHLVRIDSKLGRSMELEGQLTGDGTRIRGTWLNYELAGQEGSTGQWSAVREQPAAP